MTGNIMRIDCAALEPVESGKESALAHRQRVIMPPARISRRRRIDAAAERAAQRETTWARAEGKVFDE
jgi:hypothetical protein